MIGTKVGCIAASGVVVNTATSLTGMDIITSRVLYDGKFLDTIEVGATTLFPPPSGFTRSFKGINTSYGGSSIISNASTVGAFEQDTAGTLLAPDYKGRTDVLILGMFIEPVAGGMKLVMQLAHTGSFSSAEPNTVIKVSNATSAKSDGSFNVSSWPSTQFTLTEESSSVRQCVDYTTAAAINLTGYNFSKRSITFQQFADPVIHSSLQSVNLFWLNASAGTVTNVPAFNVEIL